MNKSDTLRDRQPVATSAQDYCLHCIAPLLVGRQDPDLQDPRPSPQRPGGQNSWHHSKIRTKTRTAQLRSLPGRMFWKEGTTGPKLRGALVLVGN